MQNSKKKNLRAAWAAEKLEQNVSGWYSDTFGLEAARVKGGRGFPLVFAVLPAAPVLSVSESDATFKAQDTY